MLATNPVTTALMKARELIADEVNHCRHILWKQGPQGQTQYCILGAVNTVVGWYGHLHEQSRCIDLLNRAAQELFPIKPPICCVRVNNTRPHADTLRMIDRAIEMSLTP